MLDRHLIRWRHDGSTEWLSLGRDGAVVEGPQSGWPQRGAERCIGLLPADQVLLLDAPRVAKSAAQLAKALPFAIEEAVIAPIESQHVAFAESPGSQTVATAVVERALVQRVLEEAKAQGTNLDALYSEAQCLPLMPDQATGLLDDGRAMVRFDRSRGLQLEASAMASWMDHRQPGTPAIHWFTTGSEKEPGEHLTRPLLVWLADHLPSRDTPNLLQGRFAPAARSAAWQSGWRWAGIAAVVAVAFAFAHLLVDRSMLKQHVEERQAQMEALLRQAVPGVQRVVDPVAQLRAAIGQQAAGQDALALLGRLSPLLVGSSAIQLEAIEYRGGVMELTVFAPDVEALDSVRERVLTLPGLKAELTGATPGSRGVEGRLRISEAAP